mmetsp:Transcript_29512/g.39774  ORF Transcript_29512/g.39774 Transcript_29512/m.39774 type:complete len:144 (+) Transcript_29512:110-541(+)
MPRSSSTPSLSSSTPHPRRAIYGPVTKDLPSPAVNRPWRSGSWGALLPTGASQDAGLSHAAADLAHVPSGWLPEYESEKRKRLRNYHSWWTNFGQGGINRFYGHTEGAEQSMLGRSSSFVTLQSADQSLRLLVPPGQNKTMGT